MRTRTGVVSVAIALAIAIACGKSHPLGPDAAATRDAMADVPTTGLVAMGAVVYDANQHVFWLADADLAGSAAARAMLGAGGLAINPNGTMSYDTAKQWVALMNSAAYLGRTDWQLPVTPSQDPSCAVGSGNDGNSFGPSCTASALGSLYGDGLGLRFPASVAPAYANSIGKLQNLLPTFYWSSGSGSGGEVTFSFATGAQFQNTTKFNYFPVLAKIAGPIGAPPSGTGKLVPYTSGPAAGLAVWQGSASTTWLVDADLARSLPLLAGSATIAAPNGTTLTPPLVDPSGTMLLATVQPWLDALNATGYAGAGSNGVGPWVLPAPADLAALFADLPLVHGDVKMTSTAAVGPFQNLQPFFYWSCARDQAGSSTSPCNGKDAGSNSGGVPMDFSFNFSSGFQGTDEHFKEFYVLPYYPAP